MAPECSTPRPSSPTTDHESFETLEPEDALTSRDPSASPLSVSGTLSPVATVTGTAEHNAAVLASLKQGIENINSPKSLTELFLFVYEVRQLLSSDPLTAWLLTLPPSRHDSTQNYISVQCATLLRNRVSEQVVRTRHRPNTTIELIQLYEQYIPDVPSEPFHAMKPSFHLPYRTKTESIMDYFNRLDVWAARFFPQGNFVQGIALIIWSSHSKLYDLTPHVDKFRTALPTFTTLDAMEDWFQQFEPIRYAVSSYPQQYRHGKFSAPDHRSRPSRSNHPKRNVTTTTSASSTLGELN